MPPLPDTYRIEIDAFGAFNAGWLGFVLGLDRPREVLARDGWDMANETQSLHMTRVVMERQRSLPSPQYRVRADLELDD